MQNSYIYSYSANNTLGLSEILKRFRRKVYFIA